MPKAIVFSREEVFTRDPLRVGQRDRVSFWRFDDDQTRAFSVVLPLDGWSEQKEAAAIAEAAKLVRMKQPRTIDLP